MAATYLTYIFGNDITVDVQPRAVERQFAAFPGANGLVSMNLGSRGRQITIRGRLWRSGNNYSTARSSLQACIDAIEAYQHNTAASYSHAGTTFNNVVFSEFKLIPDKDGRTIRWSAAGLAVCYFIATLVEQI